MWHHDLRYDTMCNLCYVNKVADKAAVCHLILNPSWGLLMQHSLKRKYKNYSFNERNARQG